ncbi:MAG: YIP1 family protein [Gammaproteobacteria bacterium]
MTDTENTADAGSQSSALSQLANLFVAPSQALDYADHHPKMWWLPLGILLLLNAAIGIWVALTINLAAMHAMMVAAIKKANPEHAEQAIRLISNHGRGYVILGVVIGLIALVFIELIYALYLFLADKIVSADSRSFGRWFSFTTWTWLPISLAYIAAMIAWGVSSHSGAFAQGDVTSLNALFFHLQPQDRLFKLAQFSILQFWVIGLVVYGLKRWCRHGTGKAVTIALIPYIVVYGLIFLL